MVMEDLENWAKSCFEKTDFGTHFFMTRFFNLSGKETVKVGLLAQAPQGKGGKRVYKHLCIEKRTVKNIRAGI